jgi:bacterioferritin (cytochrome b1)
MKLHRIILVFLAAILLAGVLPLTVTAQPCGGPGMGMGPGRSTGKRGTKGTRGTSVNIPDKLPTPKSQEWLNKLRDILSLEKLSVAQYSADQVKFQARQSYTKILRQENWHVNWITSLFKAYGVPAVAQLPAITPTNSLTQALEVSLKLETDLIPQYEWLIKNAEDKTSARVLTTILQQTRMHQRMFQRYLQALGGA